MTQWDYQASTEGCERILAVPYARLEDTTPAVGEPAAVISLLLGTQVCGVVLSLDAINSWAIIDFTPGKLYWFQVRNVLTYSSGAESTFGAINIGDPIYYDGGAVMVALGLKLSTAPTDSGAVGTGAGAAANPIFGFVVGADAIDTPLYPKGGATASTQWVGVMVRGAGA